jgi:hypothetical protein
MNKLVITGLFAFSFVAGFMLCDMLGGIATNGDAIRQIRMAGGATTAHEQKTRLPAGIGSIVQVERIASSRKAVQGNSFELVISMRSLRKIHGNYSLVVFLSPEDGGERVKIGSYSMNSLGGMDTGGEAKIGPLAIGLPAGMPLGNYIIDIRLGRDGEIADELIASPCPRPKIEIVKSVQDRSV